MIRGRTVVSAEDSLDINVRKRSQVQVVQLRGPLRMGAAVDGLRQTMEEAVGNGDTRIVVNLAEVSMIDSSGIGLLVRFLASVKQRGGNIQLVQPSKFAVQTLRLVGVLNLFEIFDNDDAAVESFAYSANLYRQTRERSEPPCRMSSAVVRKTQRSLNCSTAVCLRIPRRSLRSWMTYLKP